jgi:hypothetical protein
MKERYFQVYNTSTQRWAKYDREQGKIVDIKEDGTPYVGVPKYGGLRND